MFAYLVVHNYYNLFLYYHIIDTEEMSQRAIKQRVDKQIQLYRKEATILETATIFDGTISSIVINPGSYTALSAMTITIADPPTKATPDTATATATITGTSITSTFTITTAGAGYNSVPTVSFSGGGGTGASATAVLTTGTVTGITLVSGGSGYTSAPTISFSGGGGTGAVATCALTGTSLSSVSITNPGWYYTTAPLVSVTGGAGSGAFITSTIKDGKVISLNIISGGTGYTSSPTLTLTDAPAGVTALATLTIAGNKITGITIGTAGSGYKTAPTITIATQTSTPVTAATFQAVLGGINYVKKFAWDIQPLSLDECGVMRVLKRTYSPYVVSSTSSQPYKISVCDIQTNASHRTIAPSGSSYIPKLEVLENEYPFNPVSEPIPLPLAPQNINRIVLRIDEDMSTDIGLKITTDFLILVHILEKEPDYIEYGAGNNIKVYQEQAIASRNYV
jgi:hypothetical protein